MNSSGWLFSQPREEYEYGACVRVKTDVAKHFACVLVVARKLRAAEVVVPCVNSVDALALGFLLEQVDELLGNTVHTANCRNDPNLIAHTYLAILAYIALESTVLVLDVQDLLYRIVGVFQSSGKVGLEVVLVDPFSLFQVFLCMTDRVAVFQDIGSFSSIVYEDFVSCWGVL